MTPSGEQDHLHPVRLALARKFVALSLHLSGTLAVRVVERAHTQALAKPCTLSRQCEIQFDLARSLRFANPAGKDDCVIYKWIFLPTLHK